MKKKRKQLDALRELLAIEPEGGGYRITHDDVVRGQITDDPDSFVQVPRLIIDGKSITWEELGRMVAPNTGFRFKLEIFDRSEEDK